MDDPLNQNTQQPGSTGTTTTDVGSQQPASPAQASGAADTPASTPVTSSTVDTTAPMTTPDPAPATPGEPETPVGQQTSSGNEAGVNQGVPGTDNQNQ